MCMNYLNIDGANLLLVYKDPRPAYLHPVLFMYEQIWFINSAPRPRASFHRILTVAICQSYLYPKMKHLINNVQQCLGMTDKCEYLWLWFMYLYIYFGLYACDCVPLHVCECVCGTCLFEGSCSCNEGFKHQRDLCKCGVSN